MIRGTIGEDRMLRKFMLGAALAAFAMAAPLNAQEQPTPVKPSPVKRTILQRADVPGTNLEIIYAALEIAPGFKAGRHNHPGVVMGHVIEGDFWLALDGQPEQILHAGESATIPNRAIHNEGAGDKGVKANVVYVVEKGQPLISPAP